MDAPPPTSLPSPTTTPAEMRPSTGIINTNLKSEKGWNKEITWRGKYAFFDWDNGFGVIRKNGFTSFDNAGKRLIKQEGSQGLLTFGQAYMQKVFATYEAY